MALLRCEDHLPEDEQWTAVVEPVEYPVPALLCSYRNHPNPEPALVILDEREYTRYLRGERQFNIVNTAARIRVADTIIKEF